MQPNGVMGWVLPIAGVSPHAMRRLDERYGVTLSPGEWREIVLQVIDRRGLLVSADVAWRPDRADGKPGSETWMVACQQTGPLLVVWAPEIATITTIKPKDNSRRSYARTVLGRQQGRYTSRSSAKSDAARRGADWRGEEWGE